MEGQFVQARVARSCGIPLRSLLHPGYLLVRPQPRTKNVIRFCFTVPMFLTLSCNSNKKGHLEKNE
uniref:Uncharacterized protein n=1 Tax=Mesocestoides corti TaxID=53468 RepID=A0A5K3FWG9_MESCO